MSQWEWERKAELEQGQLLRASTRKEALRASIASAELYMKALSLASTTLEKKRLGTKCQSLLDLGERIKQAEDINPIVRDYARGSDSLIERTARTAQDVSSTRKMTTRERILLLESSKLNGFIFPPWQDTPCVEDFHLDEDQEPFMETLGYSFSQDQLKSFDGWKRLRDIFPGGPQISSPTSSDLVQDAVTDCSVVASLCALAERMQDDSSPAKLLPLRGIFHPYNETSGHPTIADSGKYTFRLTFNGCHRKVIIDDRLPSSRTNRELHVIDRNCPSLIWPALLEKAYLKVRGGYDFPGSNPGTDLSVMTGWIPEQVLLRSGDIDIDQIWLRCFQAFGDSQLLVTLGTGELTDEEESDSHLTSRHAYAVLRMSIDNISNSRTMLIKDSSCGSEPPKVVRELASTAHTDEQPGMSFRDWSSSGRFWMDLQDVVNRFDSIYLNWSPARFSYREDIHFTWSPSTEQSALGFIGSHPQLSLYVKKTEQVWLLLSRHFTSNKPRDIVISPSSEDATSETASSSESAMPFINLTIVSATQRVFTAPSPILRSPLISSYQTLVKVDLYGPGSYLIIPSQDPVPTPTHASTFTLSALSSAAPLTLSTATSPFTHITHLSSAFTSTSSGGPLSSPTYLSNPQFLLKILQPTNLAITLITSMSTPSHTPSLHLALLHPPPTSTPTVLSTYRHQPPLLARTILHHSNSYTPSTALLQPTNPLNPGSYILIPSTFHHPPSLLTPLKINLTLHTNSPITLTPLPSDSAGRLTLRPPPAIFTPTIHRLIATLRPERLTRLKITIRSSPSASPSTSSTHRNPTTPNSPVRLTIQTKPPSSPSHHIACTSPGAFLDARGGLSTRDVDLHPENTTHVIIERLPRSDSTFSLLPPSVPVSSSSSAASIPPAPLSPLSSSSSSSSSVLSPASEERFEVSLLSDTRVKISDWTPA